MNPDEALSQIIKIISINEVDKIKKIELILKQVEDHGKNSGICEIGTSIQSLIYEKVKKIPG